MNKDRRYIKRNTQKSAKQETKSTSTMRIFYILMLLLIVSSSLLRITGAGRRPPNGVTPSPQVGPANGVGTSARVLVFHQEGSDRNSCEELVVTALGQAVFSNCGNGVEKQYTLSSAERAKLQNWIEQMQPLNYDHRDQTPDGDLTMQMYLMGQGDRQASAAETQQLINFAATLAAKIAS